MKKASDTLDYIGGALIGLVTSKVRGFLKDTVPGFHEEYQKVERHKGSESPNTDPA